MTHPATHPAAEKPSSASIDKQLKAHTKILLQVAAFGLFALILAPIGESSLSRSSPIFGYLGLTYGTWQMAYVLGLTVFSIAWLVAIVHRLNIMAHCKTQRDLWLRVETDKRVKEDRRRAERLARAAPPELPRPRQRPHTERSTKFEY